MICNRRIAIIERICYALPMTTKTNPRKDFVEVAFAVFQQATGEVAPPAKPTKAQLTGRKGGLTGGKARADKLTPEQRSEIAKKAAEGLGPIPDNTKQLYTEGNL